MGNIGRQTTHLFSTRLPWKKSVQNAASCSLSASRSLMCLPGIRWIRKAAVPAIVAVPTIPPTVIGLPSGPWICFRSRRSLRSRLRRRRRLSCHPWTRRHWPLKGRGWRCSPPSARALPAWPTPAAKTALAARAAPAAVAAPTAVAAPPSLFCRCPSVLQRGSARHLQSAASCPRNTAGLLLAAIPSGGLPEPSGIEQCRCCRARQQHQGHHVAGAALLHYDGPFHIISIVYDNRLFNILSKNMLCL